VTVPAERIRLRMDGVPQENSEAAALLISTALDFCAKAETFPVFRAFTLADHAGHDWVVRALTTMTPGHLRGLSVMVAAGVVADFEAGDLP
jgi:hypothetical protein